MKGYRLPFVLSLLFVMFMLGMTFGYYVSPSYQQTMYAKDSMDLGSADRFVDLRYINAMAAHHRGALLLANQAAPIVQHPELKSLVAEIPAGETKLIEELYGWKQEWYRDNRLVQDPVVAHLGGSDSTTDLRFLNALIAHHEAGIKMTREIRAKSSRKEILDNADAVEAFLTNSIETLKAWRSEWYGIN